LVAAKKQNGGQTHVLASGQLTWEALEQDVGAADLPAAELAWWMFHRWSQENWFKYMRPEYTLDVLVDYSVELAEASDRDAVELSYERKLFTDTIKLGAYEIETRLYGMLGVTYSNSETEGCGLIRSMLEGRGDIRVESETIDVHLDQLSAPRYTQAMQSLRVQMNSLSPRLPETSHRLRFFVTPRSVGEQAGQCLLGVCPDIWRQRHLVCDPLHGYGCRCPPVEFDFRERADNYSRTAGGPKRRGQDRTWSQGSCVAAVSIWLFRKHRVSKTEADRAWRD
jgi:hypothetical protein